MGHLRFRFFAHLPANTPVQPQKFSPKSFVKTTLLLSLTRSRLCAAKSVSPRKQGSCSMGGGGYLTRSFLHTHSAEGQRTKISLCPKLALTEVEGCLRGGYLLTAPTRAATAHAAVATSVPRHDGVAAQAGGSWEGNRAALRVMAEVFQLRPYFEWRGFCTLPTRDSSLRLWLPNTRMPRSMLSTWRLEAKRPRSSAQCASSRPRVYW